MLATKFRFIAIFLLLLVFLGTALAQDNPGADTSALLITATASSQRVRYVSMGEVQQTRLQVFASDGIPIAGKRKVAVIHA